MGLCDFQVKQLIGKGGYGVVYLATRREDKKDYALKVISISKMNTEERKRAIGEIRFLASVHHPCIISYYEAFIEDNKLFIVMEYASKGDLHALIKRKKSTPAPRHFSEELVWSVLIQLAYGLQALHGLRIVHRDIKSSNIFITDRRYVKIGDLGVAKLMDSDLAKTMIGTPYYQSPEIWVQRPYDCKTDIWSLGCVMYEMTSFSYPYTARDYSSLGKKVLQGIHLPVPDCYSRELSDVIELMLLANPSQRPDIDQILALPEVQRRRHLVPSKVTEAFHDSVLENTLHVPEDGEMGSKVYFPRVPYPSELDFQVLEQAEAENRERDRAFSNSLHCLSDSEGSRDDDGGRGVSENKSKAFHEAGNVPYIKRKTKPFVKAGSRAPSPAEPVKREPKQHETEVKKDSVAKPMNIFARSYWRKVLPKSSSSASLKKDESPRLEQAKQVISSGSSSGNVCEYSDIKSSASRDQASHHKGSKSASQGRSKSPAWPRQAFVAEKPSIVGVEMKSPHKNRATN